MKRPGRVLLVTLLLTGSVAALPPAADRAESMHSPVPAPATAITDTVTSIVEEKLGEPTGPPLDTALQALATTLVIPVQGVTARSLRDNFDDRRGARRHDAIDILAPRDTPVLSASAGQVLQLSDNDDGGLMVFATDPSERFIFLYAHLEDYADGLEEGMSLSRGQVIGYVGSSGNAPRSAPHLHFAIKRVGGSLRWSQGTPVNPHPLLMPPPVLGDAGSKPP